MTAVTYIESTSNGVQLEYTIKPPFLSRDHIFVKFNGVAQPSSAFTFVDDTKVKLVTAAANNVTVRVGRLTPQTVLTDFQPGVVSEEDLDDGYLQLLYIQQELQDKYDEAIADNIATATLIATKNNLAATVNPTVTDDTSKGYVVGSFWHNSVLKSTYRASSVSTGAAVWVLDGRKSKVSTVAPGVTDDSSKGYEIGSHWWDTVLGVISTCTSATVGAATWGSLSPAAISYPLTHTGVVHDKKGSDLTVGATVNLASAGGNYIRITGTGGTISSFGTSPAGSKYTIEFTGASNIITYNDPKIRMPGNVSRTVLIGDVLELRSDGSGNYTLTNLIPHTGREITIPTDHNPVYLESFSGTTVSFLDLTGLIAKYPSYNHYRIDISRFVPVDDDVELYILLDYGSGFLTANYVGLARAYYQTGTFSANGAPTTKMQIMGITTAAWGIGNGTFENSHRCVFELYDVNNVGTLVNMSVLNAIYSNNGIFKHTVTQGVQNSIGKVEGIRFGPTTGNFTIAGKLFGII